MTFPDSEAPTMPVNSSAIMSIPQVRAALSAFPPDQHPLLLAMLRAADDNGYGRGWARLSRVGPFEAHEPKSISTLAPLGKKKKR